MQHRVRVVLLVVAVAVAALAARQGYRAYRVRREIEQEQLRRGRLEVCILSMGATDPTLSPAEKRAKCEVWMHQHDSMAARSK